MNSRELGDYKRKIMLHLITDSEAVELMDPFNEFREYPEDLIGNRIYPFDRVPDVQQADKVFVTLSANMSGFPRGNDLVRDVTFTVRVIVAEGTMMMDGGRTRLDNLSARIDELLNESYDFGIGYVTLTSNTEHTMGDKYFYRELTFKTLGLNNKRYGS